MYKATADRLPPFAACIIFPISLYLISAQMSNAADAQKQHRDAPLRTPGAASHDTAQHSCRMSRAALLYATLIFRFIVPHGCPSLQLQAAPPAPMRLPVPVRKQKPLPRQVLLLLTNISVEVSMNLFYLSLQALRQRMKCF